MISEITKIALLIDAENISYKYIETIFDELKTRGNVTIRRIYTDVSKEQAKPWVDVINKYAIIPVQQFRNTVGKNSSDMALVIDAMDILYKDPVDIFCIASSDSDFARLASRLRQSGKQVIGMGESKAPRSLVNSCDKFLYLDVITEDEENSTAVEENILPLREIKSDILEYLENEGVAQISRIKDYLQSKHPDFDTRNYGCSKFSKFMELFKDEIELKVVKRTISANLKGSQKRQEIEEFVINTINQSKNKSVNIGQLNNIVKEKYPDFTPKDYGYKQVKLFFTSIDGVVLNQHNATLR
ncbi:MAG: NYN domain-containing protein [Clostridia bacterium]|nr:NYN domain-containing protein [Clostridia bacterium]